MVTSATDATVAAIMSKVGDRLACDLNKVIRPLLFFIEQTNNIPGDIAEFGVYQGSTLACAALYLKQRKIEKTICAFDSFTGLPQYHARDLPAQFDRLLEQGKITEDHYRKSTERLSQNDDGSRLSHIRRGKFGDTSKAQVLRLMADLEVLDAVDVRVFEGLFVDTLGNLPKKLSLAFFDCDLYESYLIGLRECYPKMSRGGIMLFDEYYSLKYPGARTAVDEFFSSRPEKPRRFASAADDTFERWYVQF